MSPLELYSLATPNGQKVGIALEEMRLPYHAHLVDITKGDQFKPEFVKVNPNSKIPAIVDPDGPDGRPISIFESGAILVYLAEKSGHFLSPDPRVRTETLQWLFFQMAGVGPMFGQFGHFFKYAKNKCDHPYPLARYRSESQRLLGVLDQRLDEREYLADDAFSIADMATVPWVNGLSVFYAADDALELARFANVQRWKNAILARPLTRKGLTVCQA